MADRELAHEVLTEKQYAVWELNGRGFTQQQIAFHLDLARSTVRDHLTSATRNIDRAQRLRVVGAEVEQ